MILCRSGHNLSTGMGGEFVEEESLLSLLVPEIMEQAAERYEVLRHSR